MCIWLIYIDVDLGDREVRDAVMVPEQLLASTMTVTRQY
jgi:hypothetical protein